MTTTVGDVVRAVTASAKFQGPTVKYHLCVCDKHWHFLFISSHEYAGNHPISDEDCPGLPNEVSYISFSPVLHQANLARGADVVCHVSDQFLRDLYGHAQISKVVTPIERRKILEGIARKLGAP